MFTIKASKNGRSAAADMKSKPPETKQQLDKQLQNVSKSLEGIAKSVGNTIAEHPGISLAAALTCGVVVGWLIKRTG